MSVKVDGCRLDFRHSLGSGLVLFRLFRTAAGYRVMVRTILKGSRIEKSLNSVKVLEIHFLRHPFSVKLDYFADEIWLILVKGNVKAFFCMSNILFLLLYFKCYVYASDATASHTL